MGGRGSPINSNIMVVMKVGGENEDEPGLDIDDCPVKTRVSLLCGLLFKTAVAATAEKFCVVNIRLGFSSLREHQSIVS